MVKGNVALSVPSERIQQIDVLHQGHLSGNYILDSLNRFPRGFWSDGLPIGGDNSQPSDSLSGDEIPPESHQWPTIQKSRLLLRHPGDCHARSGSSRTLRVGSSGSAARHLRRQKISQALWAGKPSDLRRRQPCQRVIINSPNGRLGHTAELELLDLARFLASASSACFTKVIHYRVEASRLSAYVG